MTAAQGVERPGERRPDDETGELGRGQPAVGAAAVLVDRDVGDERLGGRHHRRRAHALDEAKDDEPGGVRGRHEERGRHRVEHRPGDDHGPAPDAVAQVAEVARKGEHADEVGRGDQGDQRQRGVSLLLEKDRQVGQDGARAEPHREVGDGDEGELRAPSAKAGGDSVTRLCQRCIHHRRSRSEALPGRRAPAAPPHGRHPVFFPATKRPNPAQRCEAIRQVRRRGGRRATEQRGEATGRARPYGRARPASPRRSQRRAYDAPRRKAATMPSISP